MPTSSIVTYAVSNSEIAAIRKRVSNALSLVTNLDERRKITDEAGFIIASKAQSIAPKSSKAHYRYIGVRKGKRRKRNTAGKSRIKYNPGNLRQSIDVLEKLKKSKITYVGPDIARVVRQKEYGPPKSQSDAYYAQMIYGSAKAFGDKIMVTAYLAVEPQVLSYIESRVSRNLRRGKALTGLL